MLLHRTLGTDDSTGRLHICLCMGMREGSRSLTYVACLGMCTTTLLIENRKTNHGYPTVTFCYIIIDIIVLVIMLDVHNWVSSRRYMSNHGYPMLVAVAIACQLILYRGGGVCIIEWTTNHGYPVLVVRPTVCRGSVCRGIILMRRLAWR